MAIVAQGCQCNGKQYSYDYSSMKADKTSHPHLCSKFKAKLGYESLPQKPGTYNSQFKLDLTTQGDRNEMK